MFIFAKVIFQVHRFQALFHVVGQGVVKIEVNHTYPLEQAIQAHHDLEERKTTGSIALIPAH